MKHRLFVAARVFAVTEEPVRVRTLSHSLFFFALVLAGLGPVQAQGVDIHAPITEISITPAIADVGVQRTITISGTWPDNAGCGPSGVVASSSESSSIPTLILHLTAASPPALCVLVRNFSFSPTYTPKKGGSLRVIVLAPDSSYLGQTALESTVQGVIRSQFDVTGLWYDPMTNGSGIQITHDRNADVAVGAWFLYDSNGSARWLSLQAARWKNNGEVLEGTLYETVAAAGTCPPGLAICPKICNIVRAVGVTRITFTSQSRGVAETLDSNGAFVFSSSLQKLLAPAAY